MKSENAFLPLFPIVMENLAELNIRLFQIAPYCVALLVIMIGAWFALRLIRVYLSKTELSTANYLESFQKLREEGELTEEEFRIVRKRLSLQLSLAPDKPKIAFPARATTPPSKPVKKN